MEDSFSGFFGDSGIQPRSQNKAEISFRKITQSRPSLALKLAEEYSSVSITPIDLPSRSPKRSSPEKSAAHGRHDTDAVPSSLQCLTPRNSQKYFQYLRREKCVSFSFQDAEAVINSRQRIKLSVWARWLLEVLIGRRRKRDLIASAFARLRRQVAGRRRRSALLGFVFAARRRCRPILRPSIKIVAKLMTWSGVEC